MRIEHRRRNRDRRAPRGGLLLVAALAGCDAVDPAFVGASSLVLGDDLLIVEERDGTVAAVDPRGGQRRWRFRPTPEPAPSFVTVPTRQLVCPPARTAGGTVLLRYHNRLLAVDGRAGRMVWERQLADWAAGDARCPAPTADSGVLLLRAHGLFLQKLDHGGRDSWRFTLGKLGAAVAPPRVVLPAGDALVVTRSHVASINPQGALNWVAGR